MSYSKKKTKKKKKRNWRAETCANSGKLCDTPGKFQDRKTRHMEIPHLK